MTLDIAVLVSVGRHPVGGRPRRADLDARALELALGLGGRVHLLHAGDPHEPALRDYLGMGLESLTVLAVPPDSDVLPALLTQLKVLRPALVLTGARAEQGLSGGCLPYALAQGLDYPLVPAAAGLAVDDARARVLQGLPRGRRRAVEAPLPCLVTVGPAAPPPRQSAYGPARRGRVRVMERDGSVPWATGWEERPARKRPKRLKLVTGDSAAERLKAASQMQAGRGALLVDPEPAAAARAILEYLVEEGIIRGPRER